MNQYGLLAGLVASVGALLAAGAAITAAWKRGANWAPPEDGVPTAPAKVASLLTAVAVGGLWFETGKSLSSRDLEIIAASAGGITFAFLLIYTLLIIIYVFEKEVAHADPIRTTGGFWLTPAGREGLKQAKNVQELFRGSGYNRELVWPRPARALVTIAFIIGFTGLILFGSVAIASIALSIDPSASKVPDKVATPTAQTPQSQLPTPAPKTSTQSRPTPPQKAPVQR
jgi:hypothetical protein